MTLNLTIKRVHVDAHVQHPGSRGGHIIGYKNGEPVYGKAGQRLTRAHANVLAGKFVELHNAASKEHTAAFNQVGARMWNADAAHPLKEQHRQYIAGEMARLKNHEIGSIYNMVMPLTVMDSYPHVSPAQRDQVERATRKIHQRYQRQWKQLLRKR